MHSLSSAQPLVIVIIEKRCELFLFHLTTADLHCRQLAALKVLYIVGVFDS